MLHTTLCTLHHTLIRQGARPPHLTPHHVSNSPFLFSGTPGSFGGIRLYMTELITITQKALQSQSWKIKAQGAAAMATVAREQTGSLVAPHLGLVLTALLNGLAGRTWAGKVRGLLLHAGWGQGGGRGRRLSCCPSRCAPVCVCLPGGAAQSHWVSGVQMQVGLTIAVREERMNERVREGIIGKHSPYGLTGEWSLLLLCKCSHWIS